MSIDLTKPAAVISGKKQAFSSAEKELLIALVRERPIIEDKRTNAKHIEKKKEAWEDLTTAYNSQPYVTQRTCVQLKRCWENTKSQRKKELSQEAAYMRGTGGGPPQGGSAMVTDNMVDLICPYINFTVPGVIDSNTVETVFDDVNDPGVPEPMSSTSNRKRRHDENDGDQAAPIPVDIIDDDAVKDTSASAQLNKKTCQTPTNNKKYTNEIAARIKRCHINIEQDQLLHNVRMQREYILLEREKNTLVFEKTIQDLQIHKIKLEIKILESKTTLD